MGEKSCDKIIEGAIKGIEDLFKDPEGFDKIVDRLIEENSLLRKTVLDAANALAEARKFGQLNSVAENIEKFLRDALEEKNST